MENNLPPAHALTPETIAGFAEAFRADARNAIRHHAVAAFGLEAAANRETAAANPMAFSLDLGSVSATDQKATGRCWLFASLNAMRRAALQTSYEGYRREPMNRSKPQSHLS